MGWAKVARSGQKPQNCSCKTDAVPPLQHRGDNDEFDRRQERRSELEGTYGEAPRTQLRLPPGQEKWAWVANSSTLISGERDAVLVDTFLSNEQSRTLLDWVVASGKNLTAIYITHGHGDHFFGIAALLDRFPHAKAVATPEVVKAMHAQLSPESIDGFWRKRSPGQIPDRLVAAEPLDSDRLELEGHELIVVKTGKTTRSLYKLARPFHRTDRCWRRRLQRNLPVSRRDGYGEPA